MSLRIEDLHFAYPGRPVLDGVSLQVPRGESAFLLGPSGSGKSTLLRCVAGLEAGYQGRITCGGEDLDGRPPHARGVGMLFQEPALFPHLDVWRNVAFGLRYRGVPARGQRDEALRWLELVDLAERADARVDQLSGGQRQRVALARTLAARPRVVLLDEPLAALDRTLRESLGARVRDLLAEQDVPALWVTHDEEEAFRLGKKVWRLQAGRIADADR